MPTHVTDGEFLVEIRERFGVNETDTGTQIYVLNRDGKNVVLDTADND